MEEMKNLKNALENIKEDDTQEAKLKNIESIFIDNIDPNKEKPNQQEPKVEENPEEQNPEEILGNFDALPENYKTYITKISSKFPEPKKSNIKTYGPVVIQEALKHDETKTIIPKIFAQINKES